MLAVALLSFMLLYAISYWLLFGKKLDQDFIVGDEEWKVNQRSTENSEEKKD